jgi:hypothetical protein
LNAAQHAGRESGPGIECGKECDKHDADLARLQVLWPTLPAHVRAGLVAMAAASVEARP